MKKLMYVAVFALALGFTSCGSDDDGGLDCIGLTNRLASAATAFGTDQTTENCNEYRSALQSFLDNGCSPDQASEDSVRQTLEGLGDCSVL